MSLKRKGEQEVKSDKKSKSVLPNCSRCGKKPAVHEGECIPCSERDLKCSKCNETSGVVEQGGLCMVCQHPDDQSMWPVHRRTDDDAPLKKAPEKEESSSSEESDEESDDDKPLKNKRETEPKKELKQVKPQTCKKCSKLPTPCLNCFTKTVNQHSFNDDFDDDGDQIEDFHHLFTPQDQEAIKKLYILLERMYKTTEDLSDDNMTPIYHVFDSALSDKDWRPWRKPDEK